MIKNPLKGLTPFGWHFEQEVFLASGIARAVKAGGGTGNIPKVILYESDGNRKHRRGESMVLSAKGKGL